MDNLKLKAHILAQIFDEMGKAGIVDGVWITTSFPQSAPTEIKVRVNGAFDLIILLELYHQRLQSFDLEPPTTVE